MSNYPESKKAQYMEQGIKLLEYSVPEDEPTGDYVDAIVHDVVFNSNTKNAADKLGEICLTGVLYIVIK